VNKNRVSMAARDRQRDIGAELLQAVRDIKSGKTGRVLHVEVTQATEARLKRGFSQDEIVRMLDVSVRTLQE
jgi:putative transcriptional regulator